MSLEYERERYKLLKSMFDAYKKELYENRLIALDMPIETDNGFNVERETLIDDIDEKLEILRRHIDDPYFAKLIFEDKEDGEKFNGYIGRLSVGEVSSPDDNKVVDWRAPISDLYYNGHLGDTSYNALGKKYNVNLKLKRQIEIKDNDVKSIYDFEDAVSSDEFLKPFLKQGADNRLKSIVATIQAEQNNIIRLPLFQNCIVQGVAGSGKTTVALHRISYLMYNYKNKIRPEEFLIISPNEIFMSYISSILVDLDADKSNSYSLNTVILNLIGNKYSILSKHAQYEYLTKNNLSTKYLTFKNCAEFKNVLDKFYSNLLYETFHKPLLVSGIEVLDADTVYKYFLGREDTLEELAEHGSKKLGLALYYEEALKTKALSQINFSNLDITKKEQARKIVTSGNYGFIKKMFKIEKDPTKLYIKFISNIEKFCNFDECEILKKYTLKNIKQNRLAFDDLAPLLYIISKIDKLPYYNGLKCVMIDEAQDLSILMYHVLKVIFKNATFAIFGDLAQGIYSYQSIDNWEQVSNIIGDCQVLYLNKCYRTSVEIMEEANKTLVKLGNKQTSNVVRNAGEVEHFKDNSVETIRKLIDKFKDEFKTIAIICKDEFDLKDASLKLKDLNLVILDENNINYNSNDKILLTVQTAKGLEFDCVIIYNRDGFKDDTMDLRLLYVAETRPLHKLILCNDNSTK